MDDDTGFLLKNMCCTCLSTKRKLFQLCRILDGVNNLYWLLSYDTEAFREGFHMDTANLYICWECKAVILRICRFRSQVCTAQKYLTNVAEGRCDVGKHFNAIKILSKLTHSLKDTYDHTYVYTDTHEGVIDNFIDCGPIMDVKAESDLDDVPLAELHNNFINYEVLDNVKSTFKLSRKSPELAKRRLRKKFNVDSSVKENGASDTSIKLYYSMLEMSEDEMLERIISKKSAPSYLEATYKCESCVVRFEVQAELDKHNMEFHEKRDQHTECGICKSYVKISRLNTHRSGHYTKYVCRICELVTCDAAALLDHLIEAHDVKDPVIATMKKNCKSQVIKNPGSRPRRNKTMNDKRTPHGFICKECDKYFDTKKLRWIHVQRVHREGFGCATCGKRFPFKNNLTRHEQTHAPAPPRVECTTCHKRVRADLMRAHSRIHGERERHTCAQCEKSFASRASYEHHLKYTRVHAVNDILKYKCSVCDKGYKSKGELRDHINYQHMGKTQHKCPVCGKALATRRCVTRHVKRAHDGIKESERDKICQQCGKAFRDKKGLREHELIHTGERPLSCEICGCTFRQNATLYTHKKRVHKIYPKRKQVELMESEIPNT